MSDIYSAKIHRKIHKESLVVYAVFCYFGCRHYEFHRDIRANKQNGADVTSNLRRWKWCNFQGPTALHVDLLKLINHSCRQQPITRCIPYHVHAFGYRMKNRIPLSCKNGIYHLTMHKVNEYLLVKINLLVKFLILIYLRPLTTTFTSYSLKLPTSFFLSSIFFGCRNLSNNRPYSR